MLLHYLVKCKTLSFSAVCNSAESMIHWRAQQNDVTVSHISGVVEGWQNVVLFTVVQIPQSYRQMSKALFCLEQVYNYHCKILHTECMYHWPNSS